MTLEFKKFGKIPVKPSEIEWKTFPFEQKNFSEDEEYFYFEGYLSTFGNEDRGGDIVEKGAFDESLKMHTPSLLGFHKSNEPPLGVWDSLVPNEVGLYVKGRMPKKDTYVQGRIIPQMRIGSLKSLSIGFSVWGEDGEEILGGVRYLKRLFLWEGSLVTIPMNDQANLKTKSAMLFQDEMPIANNLSSWNKVSALKRVRSWAEAKEGGLQDHDSQAKYKQAFLWHNEEDVDLFESYKLLVADIIEGKLTIIPRAVFSAAGRFRGGKEITYIPSEDQPPIIMTVEKYYKKMGLDSPFGKSFRVDDFEEFEERVLEKLLRNGVCMSEKNSKMLISYIKSGLKRDDSELDQRDVDDDGLKSILDSLKSFKN